MKRFIGGRAIQSVTVLVIASILVFLAVYLLPGDPARRLLGNQASAEQIAAKREQLGLDEPLILQFGSWLLGALRGDLGSSFTSHQSVAMMIGNALPVTLQIAAGALLLAVCIALPVAFASARNPGGPVDSALTYVSVALTSLPAFVWGLGFVLLFALTFSVLPSSGFISPWTDPVGGLRSLILPVTALALPSAGMIARVARTAIIDVMEEPYIQYANAKGLGLMRIRRVHVLKSVAAPILNVAAVEFIFLLGDAVVVETVFSLPGLGKLMVDSFFGRDYPVIQGVALLFCVLVLLTNLLADISSALVDPRIRKAAKL